MPLRLPRTLAAGALVSPFYGSDPAIGVRILTPCLS